MVTQMTASGGHRLPKKIIIFGGMFWLDAVEKLLRDAGVSQVIRVMSIDMGPALIEAIRRHKDVGALIVSGQAIRPQLGIVMQKVRSITRVPVLLVMPRTIAARQMSELKAVGVMAVVVQEATMYDELMAAFVKMMDARPQLRLVK